MKGILRRILLPALSLLARLIVGKYKPTVIMVTGSVGKTSTKDAIAAALRDRTYLRASEKSYNSEFGVPLTIIGSKNPWASPFAWVRVFKEALSLLLLPNHYPKTLILEVGADRPGDLSQILDIVTPDAVVVTRLPDIPVHVEAYASPEAVREEEFVPAYGLAPQSPLIVNVDDVYARAYAKRLPVKVTCFGFGEEADVEIVEDAPYLEDGKLVGMEAMIRIGEERVPFIVRGAVGRAQLLAPAAAIALTRALNIPHTDTIPALASYVPPPGRCRILNGKDDAILIDDTYNSSPAAVEEALTVLARVSGKRAIAVLGDMLELGRYSVAEHERVGASVAKHADVLVTVGIRARTMAEAAKSARMKETHIYSCDTATAAAELLPTLIKKGDVILIKGSQSIRMEQITEALLADPADVTKLVRQEFEWKRR